MFIGEYTHAVDEKKRISLPKKFHKGLGNKIIITKSPDACLIIYPIKTWQGIAEPLARLPMGHRDNRDFGRFMLSGAVEVEVDSIGRILIPDFLREFAGLKSKVVFAGLYDHVEVWNEKEWTDKREVIEKQADSMAEKLGDLGVL
jgi:MraZ protein